MTEPYYQDDHVTLYHGDCLEVLAGIPDESVAAVLTDPPYTERTHSRARSTSNPNGIVEFESMTDATLAAVLTECARVSMGWVIATLDYRHAIQFDVEAPSGIKVQRVGVWVKTNPTPQLTGDRPAQGWEAIAYMHRADRRSKWNGGGRAGNYISPIPKSQGHPTAKPLPMIEDWVRLFTQSGDVILDPFAGSGTTLRAAVNEGRKAIGVERDERYCELIADRMSQGVLDFGGGE